MNAKSLDATGERQVGSKLEHIAPNHRQRYYWAASKVSGTVLDAACGIGYGSFIMAEENPDVFCFGVDISQDAVDFGNEHYKHDRVLLQQCDVVKATSLIEAEWLVSFETIEHIENPLEFLVEARLSGCRNLLCSVPNEETTPFNKWNFPFHHRHYTPAEFEQLLFDAGWTITERNTQYDKKPGNLYEGQDGKILVVQAKVV